jgi:phage FluMu protein Com
MPSWQLRCTHCKRFFLHSEIEDSLENLYLPLKPYFSSEGEELRCPHCRAVDSYEVYDLTYSRLVN